MHIRFTFSKMPGRRRNTGSHSNIFDIILYQFSQNAVTAGINGTYIFTMAAVKDCMLDF